MINIINIFKNISKSWRNIAEIFSRNIMGIFAYRILECSKEKFNLPQFRKFMSLFWLLTVNKVHGRHN